MSFNQIDDKAYPVENARIDLFPHCQFKMTTSINLQTCCAHFGHIRSFHIRKRPQAFCSNKTCRNRPSHCRPLSAVLPPEKEDDGGTGKITANVILQSMKFASVYRQRTFVIPQASMSLSQRGSEADYQNFLFPYSFSNLYECFNICARGARKT